MKKILVFLLAGMLSAGILAGCTFESGESSGGASVTDGVLASGDNAGNGQQNGGTVTTSDEQGEPDGAGQTETPDDGDDPQTPEQPQESSTGETSSQEVTPQGSEEADNGQTGTPQIVVPAKTYKGDFIGEFPQITGVQNSATDAINQDIQRKQMEFEKAEATYEDHVWIECHSYSEGNSRFLNLVMLWNEYPIYGDMGTVYSHIYDIQNQKEVSVAEALEISSTQSPDIQTAFENFLSSNEMTAYRQLDSFQITGAKLLEDGTASVYLATTTSDGPDTPEELLTTPAKEIYTYHTADGSIELGVH